MKKYLQELQRRNVFKAVAAYIVIGWLLLQVSTSLEEALELPEWFDAVVTALLAIGLPIVVIFSWVYELTPEGVLKTEDVDTSSSIASKTGQRLNYITIAGIVILLAVVIFDRYTVNDRRAEPAVTETGSDAAATQELADVGNGLDRSIAVLPFVAMTTSQDDEFFADGLSEEILNVLANIDGLKVAGRTSSFYYKGRNEDLRQIADALNVQHILEGSVRRSGSRLRVTAQLVKADDGFHLWSQNFDREDGDIFAIQDEISSSVARALRTEILGEETSAPTAERNADAENFYLIAQAALAQRTLADTQRARDLYAQASQLDPRNPKYLAGYAQAVALQYWNHRDILPDEAIRESGQAIEQALSLGTPSADTLAVAGLVEELKASTDRDPDAKARALDYYRRAIESDSENILALQWLASIYLDINEPEEALENFERVVAIDPLNELALTGLSQALMSLGEFEQAKAHLYRMQALFPQISNAHRYLSNIEFNNGRIDRAAFWIERAVQADPSPLELTFLLNTYVGLGWADRALETAETFRELSSENIDLSRLTQAKLDKDFATVAAESMALFDEFGFPGMAIQSAWANALDGKCEPAIKTLERQFPSLQGEVIEYIDDGDMMAVVLLAHCHDVTGSDRESDRIIQMLLTSKPFRNMRTGAWLTGYLTKAAAYSVAGDIEQALASLAQIPQERMPIGTGGPGMTIDESPVFANLREEPAFMDYARRERYEFARQARMLAAGETEQEIAAAVEAAGYALSTL
jgi:TolB-like protein/cytochrome c-type biogenesis protein CcmH/NrfG